MLGNLFSGLICILVLFLCCNLFFDFKNNKKTMFIYYSIALIIIRSLFPIREELHINLGFALVIYVSIPLLFYAGTLISKVIFIISYIICSSLCELITMNFFSLFFFENIISNNNAFILGLITTNIFLIILMYIYSLYWKTFLLKNLPKNTWLIISLPITTLLLIVNIDDYIETINNTSFFGLTILGLLLSNIACIYIYYKTVLNISKEIELKQALEKKNLEYDAAQKILSQHNVFLHAIRENSKEMLSLLSARKLSELERYINEVFGNSTNVYNMINTNCKIVDVLINDRIYILKNNNIIFRAKLENTDFDLFDMIELEKIFKCFIDLAINECSKSKLERPYLYIKSKKIEKKTIITFNFSSVEEIEDDRINDEVKNILNKHNCYYLVDNKSDELETCISILLVSGEC